MDSQLQQQQQQQHQQQQQIQQQQQQLQHQHQLQQHLQQLQQLSGEEPPSDADSILEMKKQKLFYLQKISKELEKTNNRLHMIIENQKQESRNHDRMIELLYHISYSK